MATRKGIGGPNSATGKGRSSQNSTKHGARSTSVLILADETQEDYDEVRNGWLANYEPADYHEMRLVEQLILNDWLMQRANKRLLEAEAEGEEHRIELMMRYKTTNERAFYRSLNAIEGLRKDMRREGILNRQLLEKQDVEIEKLKQQLAKQPAKPEVKAQENKILTLLAAPPLKVSPERPYLRDD